LRSVIHATDSTAATQNAAQNPSRPAFHGPRVSNSVMKKRSDCASRRPGR